VLKIVLVLIMLYDFCGWMKWQLFCLLGNTKQEPERNDIYLDTAKLLLLVVFALLLKLQEDLRGLGELGDGSGDRFSDVAIASLLLLLGLDLLLVSLAGLVLV